MHQAVGLLAGTEERAATPAVAARGLWFSYGKGAFTLKDLDLEVLNGTVCMVLGASGSGKTTLLKLLKGLLRPHRGSLRILGADGQGRAARRAQEIAYIPQHLGLVQNMTVLENALVGALSRVATLPSLVKTFPKPVLEEAAGVLDLLGIGDKAGLPLHTLSGGERQRVAVARALLQRARLVLADEFVSQLDPVRAGEVMEAMRRLALRGTTFIITAHEVGLVSAYGDQAILLRRGEKAYDGAADLDSKLARELMR